MQTYCSISTLDTKAQVDAFISDEVAGNSEMWRNTGLKAILTYSKSCTHLAINSGNIVSDVPQGTYIRLRIAMSLPAACRWHNAQFVHCAGAAFNVKLQTLTVDTELLAYQSPFDTLNSLLDALFAATILRSCRLWCEIRFSQQ